MRPYFVGANVEATHPTLYVTMTCWRVVSQSPPAFMFCRCSSGMHCPTGTFTNSDNTGTFYVLGGTTAHVDSLACPAGYFCSDFATKTL